MDHLTIFHSNEHWDSFINKIGVVRPMICLLSEPLENQLNIAVKLPWMTSGIHNIYDYAKKSMFLVLARVISYPQRHFVKKNTRVIYEGPRHIVLI